MINAIIKSTYANGKHGIYLEFNDVMQILMVVELAIIICLLVYWIFVKRKRK